MTCRPLKTVEQFAEALNLSPHTIRAWLIQGHIEYVRLGRSIRIPAEEIERLREAGTVPAQSPRLPAS